MSSLLGLRFRNLIQNCVFQYYNIENVIQNYFGYFLTENLKKYS